MRHVLAILMLLFSASISFSKNISHSINVNRNSTLKIGSIDPTSIIHEDQSPINTCNGNTTNSSTSQEINVIIDSTLTGRKKDFTISEVVVTGTRHNTESRFIPNTITQVSRGKLSESHDFSVIPTTVDLTPGLFTTSRGILGFGVHANGAGSMRIRGMGGTSRLLVLIDGQPQFAGLMSHPIPDMYQTMMTEKVEILRGPSSLYYGSNAMGGVINIISRKMVTDGFKTEIDLQGGSYGTTQAQVTSRIKVNKLSGIVGFQHQQTDGHRKNSEFRQTAGFLKINYKLSYKWDIAADLNITHIQTSNPGPEYAPLFDNDYKITRGLTSMQLSDNFGWANGAFRFFFDWGHHNIDDGTTDFTSLPTERLYLHNDYITGFNLFQTARLFSGNRSTFGIEFQNYGGSAWNKDKATGSKTYLMKDEEGNIVHNQHVNDIAAYIDLHQAIINWLTLDAGIRIDHHSTIGTEWIPQVGIIFHTSPFNDIKALISKGFRNPTIKDMYMFAASSTDLHPERVMNYEIALSGSSEIGFNYGANIFYMEGCNIINTVRTDGKPRNINTGNFYHWGIEINGSYRINEFWGIDANYSFLHMHTPLEGSPEHKTYIGGTYKYHSLTIRPSLLCINHLPLSDGKDCDMEDYALLNLSTSYNLNTHIQLFVNGENLFSQHYQTYAGFYMPRATIISGIRINL